MSYPAFNHGDEVCLQHRFWTELVNSYIAAGCPDPEYLAKIMGTAAEWQSKYDDYMAHLCAIKTTYPLSF
jgi:hypothetical protein